MQLGSFGINWVFLWNSLGIACNKDKPTPVGIDPFLGWTYTLISEQLHLSCHLKSRQEPCNPVGLHLHYRFHLFLLFNLCQELELTKRVTRKEFLTLPSLPSHRDPWALKELTKGLKLGPRGALQADQKVGKTTYLCRIFQNVQRKCNSTLGPTGARQAQ